MHSAYGVPANKVEAVQRRAARIATGNYQSTSRVTAMLQQIQWQPLQSRRACAQTVMMYRIVYNLLICQRNTTSTAPLLEPDVIHYDSWYHTQELQCTGHHFFHKPYASETNYREVWCKQTP